MYLRLTYSHIWNICSSYFFVHYIISAHLVNNSWLNFFWKINDFLRATPSWICVEKFTKYHKKFSSRKPSLDYRVLTSSKVKQYQQKTWLHLLHIIWAHPVSLSIGIEQTGQCLIIPVSSNNAVLSLLKF